MNASLTVPKLRKRLVYRPKKFIYATKWEKGIPAVRYKAPGIEEAIEESYHHIYSEM
jgi:hypothetical protein